VRARMADDGVSSTANNSGGRVAPVNARPPLTIPTGATLLRVIHDFSARSPDELTLRKGEHVELLEKDGRN